MLKYEKVKLHQDLLTNFVDMLCNISCRNAYPFSLLKDYISILLKLRVGNLVYII